MNKFWIFIISVWFLMTFSISYASFQVVAELRDEVDRVLYLISLDNGKNTKVIKAMVEESVSDLFDFNRMTALAVGFSWKSATIEQKKILTNEFKNKLFNAYYQILSQIKAVKVEIENQAIEQNNGKELLIRSKAYPTANPSNVIEIDYNLYKSQQAYKIYNVKVGGVSLVTVYRGEFENIIQQKGIDGLIEKLQKDSKQEQSSQAEPQEVTVGAQVKTDIALNSNELIRNLSINFCSNRLYSIELLMLTVILKSECASSPFDNKLLRYLI